jgi:hypothetical protein
LERKFLGDSVAISDLIFFKDFSFSEVSKISGVAMRKDIGGIWIFMLLDVFSRL